MNQPFDANQRPTNPFAEPGPRPQHINPFATPQADLQSPQFEAEQDFVLADRSTRFAAAMLDGLLYFVAMVPMFVVFAIDRDSDAAKGIGTGLFLITFATLAAFQWYLIHTRAQSLGKIATKIKIATLDGSPVTFVNGVILRNWIISAAAAIPGGSLLSIVDALFIYREDRRCLHDLIAKTTVIRADVAP